MDSFDLLPLHPMSISVANIDPFRQSGLIEGSPFFLLNGQGKRCMTVRWFYPHQGEKWLISPPVLFVGKLHLLHVLYSL